MAFKHFLKAITPTRQQALYFLVQMAVLAMVMQVDAVRSTPANSQAGLQAGNGQDKKPPSEVEGVVLPGEKVEEKSAVAIVFERIFQALAIASNIAFQLSPMRVILEIRRYKDTKGSDGLPYLMIFCVGFQWVYYASFAMAVTGNTSLQLIIFGNVLGVLLGAFYIWSYQKNCNDQIRANKMKIFYRVAATIFIAETISVIFISKDNGVFVLGLVGTVMSILTSAAPLTELSVVLKTRDTSTWPTDFIYVNSVGLTVWLICGILLKDNWVIIPNSIGLGICLFQISLIIVFGSDPSLRRKKLRKDEMTFHVIDETSSLVPETLMKKGADGKITLSYEPMGEDAQPHVKGSRHDHARVMW